MKKAKIGGQAVIEGVMMKSPTAMCIAVRTEKGIKVKSEKLKPSSKTSKIPIIRGITNFISMMIMGVQCISSSTEMLDLMEEEPTKFEKWLSKVTGKSLEKIIMGVAVFLAILMSVFLFILLPIFAGEGLQQLTGIESALFRNSVEGVIRIVIFLLYLILVTRMSDIKRTFMYHGAEHKTIHCFEHETELTVENAKKFSRLHPRCGTSFLLIVMIVSILVFSLGTAWLPETVNVWWFRTLLKLAFLPLVAGVSYELLRLLAMGDNKFIRALRYPGLQLQRLTTKEPDDSMLEVAIAAFEGVRKLDGEEPCSDNPPATYEKDSELNADVQASDGEQRSEACGDVKETTEADAESVINGTIAADDDNNEKSDFGDDA